VSTLAPTTRLGEPIIRHLDAQLASARRLLDHVLRQGRAIRAQDVDGVLALLAAIQTEMELRGGLEGERTALLAAAGVELGVPGPAVTLDAICSLMGDDEAAQARERSAQLRGLLSELQREHTVNRALMRQELAFLDHLTRLMSGATDLGYEATGESGREVRIAASSASAHRVLDLEA
jgi:FlgN protein